MSKAISLDHSFNRKEFSDLLIKAKGGRSQNEFSSDCNISPSYLNRYIHCKKDNPPIPSTIKRIATAATNNVSFNELLQAAGYDPKKYMMEYPSVNILNKTLSEKKATYTTIIDALSSLSYKWSVNPETGDKPYDFSITIENGPIDRWFFEYIFDSTYIFKPDLYIQYYTNILASHAGLNSKYSFITNSEQVISYFMKYPPYLLNLLISVILVDVNRLSIIKEVYLNSSTNSNEFDAFNDIKKE